MTEAVSAISVLMQPDALAPASRDAAPTSSFGTWFSKEMSSVNDKLVNADSEIQNLATGEAQSLHQTMIHLEEAKLSFQLMLQVRNHLLEAYQEVMRTQV